MRSHPDEPMLVREPKQLLASLLSSVLRGISENIGNPNREDVAVVKTVFNDPPGGSLLQRKVVCNVLKAQMRFSVMFNVHCPVDGSYLHLTTSKDQAHSRGGGGQGPGPLEIFSL